MSEINIEEIKVELSEWIQENWDPDITVSEWWKRLSDGGWSATSLPVEAGGRGWSRVQSAAVMSTLFAHDVVGPPTGCLLYTSPSPRDLSTSRMPSSA